MIDLKEELHNYPAIDLKGIEENGTVLSDNIKNSIVLYNKALDSIRLDSEDIAIIELKKAVAINPNFHEAMNLLGLCFYYTKDYAKASEMFNKVIEAENNSINALRYLNELNSGSDAAVPDGKKKASGKAKKVKNAEEGKAALWFDGFKTGERSNLFRYAAGFLLGAIVVLVVTLPLLQGRNENIDNSGADLNKPADESVSELKTKLDKLNNDFSDIKNQLDRSNSELDYYKNAVKLFDVDKLVVQKDYEAAADMLLLLKTVDFKGTEKEKFDNLYKDNVPKAVWLVYNDAMRLYSARNYQESIKRFTKMQSYGSGQQYMDAGLYYLGKCYQALNESKNALDTFQKLKKDYPSSQFAVWADAKIRELTGQP